jgi:hypothetical protein
MYVCGPCATINPDEIVITPLPLSNELEVPFGDQSIATCPNHYEPTLRATIMLTRASGADDTRLQELLAAYMEEGAVEDEPEEESSEERQEESELPEGVGDEGFGLEEVNDELSDLDEEDEGPDYYEALKAYAWNYTIDWSQDGRDELRKWMVSQGMSDRGKVRADLQTRFALLHVGSGALAALLNPRAYQKFMKAYNAVV